MQPKLLKCVIVHLCELQFNERFITVLLLILYLVFGFAFFNVCFCLGFSGGGKGLEHVVKCFFLKIVKNPLENVSEMKSPNMV